MHRSCSSIAATSTTHAGERTISETLRGNRVLAQPRRARLLLVWSNYRVRERLALGTILVEPAGGDRGRPGRFSVELEDDIVRARRGEALRAPPVERDVLGRVEPTD